MPFYQNNSQIHSTIAQPNNTPNNPNQCYFYSVKCANEISGFAPPNPNINPPPQMGGNGMSVWTGMGAKALNYQCNLGVAKIFSAINAAIANNFPAILLVTWSHPNGKTGSHCVYICGTDGQTIVARDQQNSQQEIRIDTSNGGQTSGVCANQMTYTMTSITVGALSLAALKPVQDAAYPPKPAKPA